MPRPKGSKNKRTLAKLSQSMTSKKINVADQVKLNKELIDQALNDQIALDDEITKITGQIKELQATLKKQKATYKKNEKRISTLEEKTALLEKEAEKEAEKEQLESALKQCMESGMSLDEILKKLS